VRITSSKRVLCNALFRHGDVCFSLNDATLAVVDESDGKLKFKELSLQIMKSNHSIFGNYM
jgi:hypothetical protein